MRLLLLSFSFMRSTFFLFFSSFHSDSHPGNESHSSLSSASLFCAAFLPLPGFSRVKVGVTLYAEVRPVEQRLVTGLVFNRVVLALEGACPGVFVTKNPRSPRVWSAAASSRGGRVGNRSTSQSSLCLKL